MQPGQTQFSGAQKEWVRKVKKELSKKCSKALHDREEATMEAEMVRIWDQEEIRTPKKPRTNASYGLLQPTAIIITWSHQHKCVEHIKYCTTLQ
jgi:hypothetical protein